VNRGFEYVAFFGIVRARETIRLNESRKARTGANNSEDGVSLGNDPLLGGVSNRTTTGLRDSLPEYLDEHEMRS
jgi:hypothetical protein